MAKRFTDTGLNRQAWFRKLKPRLKCAARFLFDECDVAGVWAVDMETMAYFVGEPITIEELFREINSDKEDRIEKFGNDKIFIPGFVEFQYGMLSEKCKPHKPIIEKLYKYGLYERVCKGYAKGIDTLEEKEKEIEEEKEEDRSVRKGKSDKWNSRPAQAEYDLPLTEHETQTCIEYIFRLKQTELSPSRLNDYWHAFKIQQFTGGKFYPDRSRCIDHFRNWLKGQDLATKPLETKLNGRKQNIQDERTRKILEEAERARK